VGATPVTAVPLRVSRGPHSVEARFRDGRSERVPLPALPDFATEEKNPRNARGVRSIEVTVPGAPAGLRLLDTPGVGSLALSGAAQAFAWLPRCDFGLVLVAAGTPLGRDEIALLTGLRHAGIDCGVLLSEADLLDPADRERARGYVASELGPVLGPDARVERARGVDARGPSRWPRRAAKWGAAPARVQPRQARERGAAGPPPAARRADRRCDERRPAGRQPH
jgi:hypothetical protein